MRKKATSDGKQIIVDKPNSLTGAYDVVDVISTSKVAKAMVPENMAVLLGEFINNMQADPIEIGIKIGSRLCRTHRYLQGQIINMLLHILRMLAAQKATDLRNERMVTMARIATEAVHNANDGFFWQADRENKV